jgi:hypothetical protein
MLSSIAVQLALAADARVIGIADPGRLTVPL